MERRKLVLAAAAGLACFALGVGAARYFGAPAAPPTAPVSGVSLFGDAGPRIMIDPASVELLPDASLRLDVPRAPFDDGRDAGADRR